VAIGYADSSMTHFFPLTLYLAYPQSGTLDEFGDRHFCAPYSFEPLFIIYTIFKKIKNSHTIE